MRTKIIAELVDHYEKEENEVINILKDFAKITPYKTMISKDRTVINKSLIKKEEQIVLDYYKLLLNRYCNIKFPNRSYIMTELMNLVPFLHNYYAFTIYKFDFKEFFYNISPKQSFKYISDSVNLKTSEFTFLKNYTNDIEELIPGVGLHNSLIELSGDYFDFEVKKAFKDGFLYYARYVDDCILILDEKVDENKIENTIIKLMKKCLGNKMEINLDKTEYYHSGCVNYNVNYLGYVFQKGQLATNPFKFGIAKKKLDKYAEQINNIVLEYKDNNDLEMLSLKLELVFKRIVYYGTRKNSKKYRWQVRGISDSYKELKRFMKNNEDYKRITKETETFFGRSIERSFAKNRIEMPAKIKNQLKNKKFISCFLNNRALLLHQKLGLNHSKLKEIVTILNKDNLENHSYSDLANILLTRIR
ncbi:hypothetical protein CN939_30685 [Bacillus thuringiensis]|uniref:reverse transcriptase domain-containing protein n=1 Tax=Bacillus thuringiensis TaxID=1428 RepID=UPI000BEB51A0|nr:reverse transcriptase domain-containing protein [Bacillus thuringiensis]PEF83369.1 hypothetical protein CON51_32365 [Bacillus thuringiensis]PES58643.1 hypothetical protein CN506_07375 [Bacillus thuringiensis]PFS65345.1 hypothetical protein COK64_03135 [Bacillus thuringiensis]PGL56955.1 hypothetical protein CN939_30685 [Bacillus thuringiensis]